MVNLAANPLSFVGSGWSLFPPHDEWGDLNILTGTRKITADILHVLLLRQGEDPMNPTLGIAPEIFEPLSNYAPQFFVYSVQEALRIWLKGQVEQFYIDFVRYRDSDNQIRVEIQFIPKMEPDVNILTFGYYAYQGAVWNQGIEPLLDSVAINGLRLRRF